MSESINAWLGLPLLGKGLWIVIAGVSVLLCAYRNEQASSRDKVGEKR